MKQQNKILIFILVLALSTLACIVTINGWDGGDRVEGSGNVITEERRVSGIDKIDMAGIGYLVIEFGDEESLTVEAEDNIIEYIETTVMGQTLNISLEDGHNFQPMEPIRFYLTVVEVEKIEVSGLGDVKLPEIEMAEFAIDISGGGNVDIDQLDASLFEVDISGVGNLEVAGGTVVRQVVSISGGGNYKARRLESQDAEVDISGLGNATVRVSETLDVSIGGGGNVDYYGNPTVDSNVTGLGKIQRMGD
ncbi:MAG: head GIN domain-containing protein [Anaerolineales bacterium]